MEVALFDLGLVIAAAALFGLTAHLLKQPPILGYLTAGLLLPLILAGHFTGELLSVFSHLGVAFLLFMIGIELKITEIREIGKVSLVVGVLQVLITGTIGALLAYENFNFSLVESAYLGIALALSSTVIVVKLLGEKGEINSLYGRITLGVLIVQDLIAVIALVVLNSIGNLAGGSSTDLIFQLAEIVISAILLVMLVFTISRIFVLALGFFAYSTELLLLGVIAWALLLAGLTQELGFSLEVGAFLAGMSLAASPLNIEIAAKIKPLRDFFIVMFFVALGTSLSFSGITTQLPAIIIFSVFVLIGNPLILLIIMGIQGYHRRISFLTGLTVSQISEFSLIMMGAGVAIGQIRPDVMVVLTGVGVITFLGSSYFIKHGENLYRLVAEPLKFFQRKKPLSIIANNHDGEAQVLLIGAHRTGKEIIRVCNKVGVKLLVLDNDPVVLKELSRKNETVYGDVSDEELLDGLKLDSIKVVISTVPVLEDNLILLNEIKQHLKMRGLILIIRAKNENEIKILKNKGANYVYIPELAAGEKVVEFLNKHGVMEKLSNTK